MAQQLQQHVQVQVPLQQMQQVQAELLKSQIDSMFEVFDEAIKYKKSRKPNQKHLVQYNDAAVSLCKLFGAQCDRLKSKEEDECVLRAVYGYYAQKKAAEPEQDLVIIKSWLQYIEAALASQRKLKPVKISKQAVKSAEHAGESRLGNFISKILGQKHDVDDKVKHVEQNTSAYQQHNKQLSKETEAAYNVSKQRSKYPSQSAMYDYAGGSEKVEYASALKTYGKQAKNEDFDHDMGVDLDQKNDADEVDSEQSTDMDGDENMAIKFQPYDAVLVDGAKKYQRDQLVDGLSRFSVVSVPYPLPCRVLEEREDGKHVLVQFPKPYNDMKEICLISNIVGRQSFVNRVEQTYMKVANIHDLGYD